MAGIYDFIREEYEKAKKAFGLIGGIPKTFKNNPRNAETMDAIFGLGGIVPGIGDAVSAAEAKYRYDQGDMLGAGLAGLGALPLVPSMAGMFIGKGAKTWDVVKADQAMQMEKAGKPPREIWAQTGNWKAPDGQWRQEIPDNSAKLNLGYGGRSGIDEAAGKLDGILEHQDLYESYPDTRNIWSGIMEGKGLNEQGMYNSNPNAQFHLYYPQLNVEAKSAKSPVIHELQHAIQQREGWARGGSPDNVSDLIQQGTFNDVANKILWSDKSASEYAGRLLATRNKIIERLIEETGNQEGALLVDKYYKNALGIDQGLWSKGQAEHDLSSFLTELEKNRFFTQADDYRSSSPELLARLDAERRIFNHAPSDAHEAYHRLAGEAEARATQARMNMDMPQRLATFPEDSYDVPMDQLIVRYGDGPSMSTSRPVNHLGQPIPPTPYELAHMEAQRNAALPVKQGGLGLPPGNTAMDRARAMGFDTPAWRGTDKAEKVSREALYGAMGPAHYSGDDPLVGNAYAGDLKGANVIPMLLRGGYVDNMVWTDMVNAHGWAGAKEAIKAAGKSGVHDAMFENAYATFDPSRIRSRFAAFNPQKRDSADILAGLAAPLTTSALLAALLAKPDEAQAK